MQVQLSVMVKNLRAEVGHALNVAQGNNQLETLKYLLARTQEELWTAFIWPELVTRAQVSMSPGQFTYAWPTGFTFDQVRSVYYARPTDSSWTEIDYGIGEDLIAPNGNNTERSDPVQLWDVSSATSFRVWPTPDLNVSGYSVPGSIRFKGQRELNALTLDSDMPTLDATCIILFAAAELLARAKAEDAPGKAQKAQRHLQKLLGNKISAKRKVTTIGSGSPDRRLRNDVIRVGAGG